MKWYQANPFAPVKSFTLPWGEVANSEGVYSNIIKSAGGGDSIKNTVNISVKEVLKEQYGTTICIGQQYAMPSGKNCFISRYLQVYYPV